MQIYSNYYIDSQSPPPTKIRYKVAIQYYKLKNWSSTYNHSLKANTNAVWACLVISGDFFILWHQYPNLHLFQTRKVDPTKYWRNFVSRTNVCPNLCLFEKRAPERLSWYPIVTRNDYFFKVLKFTHVYMFDNECKVCILYWNWFMHITDFCPFISQRRSRWLDFWQISILTFK